MREQLLLSFLQANSFNTRDFLLVAKEWIEKAFLLIWKQTYFIVMKKDLPHSMGVTGKYKPKSENKFTLLGFTEEKHGYVICLLQSIQTLTGKFL